MNISGWSILLIGILAFVFSIWMYYPDLIWYFQARSYVTENTGLGEFGDMYGSLNTLFSGLAFSAVVVTLLLQKQQLSISQQELKLTREEMASQGVTFEQQTQVMNQQLFEGTFFQLLKLYIEQSSFYSTINPETRQNKWMFIYDLTMRKIHSNLRKDLDSVHYNEVLDYGLVISCLNHILFLLNILKYIDESSLISSDKKWFYVQLLKSNIPGVGISLVAIFSAYDEKLTSYKPYIEKYSFLDDLDLIHIIPLNVFCSYKLKAYLSLREDVFDRYIAWVIQSGLFSCLYSFDNDEMICNLSEISSSDGRKRYLGCGECIIQ